jgi:signal transduction histidine kinase
MDRIILIQEPSALIKRIAILKYFSFIGLGIIALCLFQSMYFTNKIITLYVSIWLILSLTAGIIALYNKFKPAKYFLTALSALILGVIIRATKVYFPESSFLQFDYAFQLGFMIEAILLSLALGNRIKQMGLEQKLETEKIQNRIARDLHDELGSNFSSISLISKMALENKSIDQQTSGRLKKISDAADHSVNSIREIIWFINTENVIFGKLIDQIKLLTAGIGEDISIRFSAENVTRDMELNVHITRNLYLSIKEIFNNINKHSNASNVEIDISNKTNSIRSALLMMEMVLKWIK